MSSPPHRAVQAPSHMPLEEYTHVVQSAVREWFECLAGGTAKPRRQMPRATLIAPAPRQRATVKRAAATAVAPAVESQNSCDDTVCAPGGAAARKRAR